MKRFLILMLLMLFQPFQLLAAGFNIDGVPNANINAIDGKPIANVNTMDGVPAAVGCSATPFDSQENQNDTTISATDTLFGQGYYQPGATKSLCRVDIYISSRNCTAAGNFTIRVYTMTGADLDTLLGESSTVIACADLAPTAWNTFLFSSSVTLSTGGTNYAIGIYNNGSTQVVPYNYGTVAGMSGGMMQWLVSSKANIGDWHATWDQALKLYSQ